MAGIAPAVSSSRMPAYLAWLEQGYAGEMAYLARQDRVERRADPAKVLPGVRSMICVGMNYYTDDCPTDVLKDPARGLISRYAWGNDYHDLMLPRLEQLASFIRSLSGTDVRYRAYVDTGPVLERAYAVDAGLGFIGKNTCLINPRRGSWLFLGVILTTAELEPTEHNTQISCGTCTRCLEACPTQALVAPYVLDARRCISYLTIELNGPIPRELRPLIGNRVFGCDVCQSVCPWQRFAKPSREKAFSAQSLDDSAPLLAEIISLDEASFRQRFRDTPLWRGKRRRLLRNAAVALGNWGDGNAIPPLKRAIHDNEPLIRGHAAWALGRIGGTRALRILEEAMNQETDSYVQQEILLASRQGRGTLQAGNHAEAYSV